MKQTKLKPNKERVDPNDLLHITQTSSYPKPRWMLNDSVKDTVWLVPKVAIDIKFYEKNKGKASKIIFKKALSTTEHLTDTINHPLLIDIQNSLLYLDTTGQITRPKRVSDILKCATQVIQHANELRNTNNKPNIRSLAQIKFEEVQDYLLSFSVDKKLFSQTLENIIANNNSISEINWGLLKAELNITSRRFKSLRHKLRIYLKANKPEFIDTVSYHPEYPNANYKEFDIDTDLIPSEKTISNEISKLEALYTSRSAQKHKFQHSPMSLFSCGRTIFETMIESQKTPLMPVNVSLHTLSAALHFTRVYGVALREYSYNLYQTEVARIKELGIAVSTSKNFLSPIKKYAFENTLIPESLSSLHISSWGDYEDILHPEDIKQSMSVSMAIRLYTAAIWIQLASFTAGRLTSLQTLKRNCFKQSPVDGLFDLMLRIPKTSERTELEDVYRPIPDLIYDYGLEFAALTCGLEERRGYIAEEQDLFLFGGILRLRSSSAFMESNLDVCKFPLGIGYINTSLDIFMDWINSPLINGKRWYPSTHQFRRLFAVLYFNFSDQIGLDELSWFMGHSSLDQTFHYAEVSHSDEWTEEAEVTIARIGASLNKTINADNDLKIIIEKARKETNISLILEPLVRSLIDEHKEKTGKKVHFHKVDDEDVFFYFTQQEDV
jgi:hypothetical protein